MKRIVLVGIVLLTGCSIPTAPTPPPIVNVPITPPVVVVPTPTPTPAPTRNPLLDDPRFNLAFYRMFALNGYESPQALSPLRRHSQAPRIFLFTVNDLAQPIDQRTLDMTAAALENVAGALTGRFGVEGIERGTRLPASRPNWIIVQWSSQIDRAACGRADVGGMSITLYPRTPNCACGGFSIRSSVVKHELGHALGYWHTDAPTDLMWSQSPIACDQNPSDRERFHAQVAYSMPNGSLDP